MISNNRDRWRKFRLQSGIGVAVALAYVCPICGQQPWQGHARDAQHSAQSALPSQNLGRIVWQTPVDLQPQFEDNDLFIHYGSPVITSANTVIVPVKTGADDGFELMGHDGGDGHLLWTQTTDYTSPRGLMASYGPTLTPQGRLYWAGGGGTLYYRNNPDTPGAVTPHRVNFYLNRRHRFSNAKVHINTPLTSDANGTIYFGFEVDDGGPKALGGGGIARVDRNGRGSFMQLEAQTLAGMTQLRVPLNSAPALSPDGGTLYIAAHGTAMIRNGMNGYLFALDSRTLHVKSSVLLLDPSTGEPAQVPDEDTASPTVGRDGKVFFGVLENPPQTDKGWLLQFTGDLSQISGAPGAFGSDDTASIVPSSIVPSYQGSSPYLLMTKYNDYAGSGGQGLNRLAILDPNDSQVDSRTGATMMKEVLTILGQTPDPDFVADHPGAVREWCINTAVVDRFSHSVLANSEDGKLYRWDLPSNTFTEVICLTPGIGESYTPTLIGTDGKVYAINDATLFAVGK